ncbi:MAG: pentapeptide repeat-containing protein [Pseudomonadota bacterium]
MDQSDRLDQIEKIAQNARSTWFGLLVLVLFVDITLMAHQDADFFAHGAATTLPLINIQVPPTAFYMAAPLFTAAVYCYLHIFLFSLWEALGQIDQRLPGNPGHKVEPLSHSVYPTLFTVAGLIWRNRCRKDGCIQRLALGNWTVALAVILGWLFPPAVVGIAWWWSMPAYEWWTTAVAGFGFACALCVCYMSFLVAHDYLSGKGGARTSQLSAERIMVFLVLLGSVWAVGLERTTLNQFGMMAQANLIEARLTVRPADWKPFELWLRDYRQERDGEPTTQDPLIPTEQEMQRYRLRLAALDSPNLQQRDLTGARLIRVFAAGGDFRRAKMPGVTLQHADLQGASLRAAQLPNVNLGEAKLQGADLVSVNLNSGYLERAGFQGALLGLADLEWTNLRYAQFQGASLPRVKLHGALLENAIFDGANLWDAKLHGARMQSATLRGAGLRNAKLHGANLYRATFGGADLRRAKLHGAILSQASLSGADCRRTDFTGVLAHQADLRCAPGTLKQDQLMLAVGNADTVLPEGFWIWSCLDADNPSVAAAMEDINAALDHYNRYNERDRIAAELFCDDDEQMLKIGDLASNWPVWHWRSTQMRASGPSRHFLTPLAYANHT